MLKRDFECHFIIRNPLESLEKEILSVCSSIISIEEPECDLDESKFLTTKYFNSEDIVVLDGYHFVTSYQKAIKDNGCKLVCIDDIHTYHFLADIIINHAGGINSASYSTESYTQFCLGIKYALLRAPFIESAKAKNNLNQKLDNIFICLGGADPQNDALKVLTTCAAIDNIKKCYVVLGSAYKYKDQLVNYVKKAPIKIELLVNVSADVMVKYMQKCGRAITSPSTISYEYLSVGGLLYLKTIAENQKEIHRFFIENKIAFDIEDINKPIDKKRIGISIKDFDGQQNNRFLKLFRSLTLKTRNATLDDLTLYYEWVNEPVVRKQSYNSNPISLENHLKWYTEKLSSKNCIMYVVEMEKIPIGQIRFEISSENIAIISFSVDVNFRGKSLGQGILRTGIAQFNKDHGAKYQLIGYVKKDNIASLKAFRFMRSQEHETKDYPNSYKYIIG